MAQNWPTRYRCRKCTRSTSNYPVFCSNPECPVKRDWMQDNFFGIIVCVVIAIGYGYIMITGGK
jgi:hypothetical protein